MRNVIKKHLKHEQYKNILETGDRMNSCMKMIRSFDHNIYTVNVNKVSLSAYDDKRFIKDDGISSYAYGHNAIISCTMQDGDIGANSMDVNLGAAVKNVDMEALRTMTMLGCLFLTISRLIIQDYLNQHALL